MQLQSIPIEEFTVKSYGLFEKQWLLLTSGDYHQQRYNAMTISWGGLGVMWGKPFTQVVVRPGRYTFEFMEQYDSFTLCAFPRGYRKALTLLGTKSGRDGDKITEAGLTPCAASAVKAPGYTEADLIIECRKIYWQDLDPSHFLAAEIHDNYTEKDYHRVYYGEIVAVQGSAAYR